MDQNRHQVNTRIDHNFNSRHKLSIVYTYERDYGITTEAGISQWPKGYNGEAERRPRLFTVSLVSTLKNNLVNEARVGYKNSAFGSSGAASLGRKADDTSKDRKSTRLNSSHT